MISAEAMSRPEQLPFPYNASDWQFSPPVRGPGASCQQQAPQPELPQFWQPDVEPAAADTADDRPEDEDFANFNNPRLAADAATPIYNKLLAEMQKRHETQQSSLDYPSQRGQLPIEEAEVTEDSRSLISGAIGSAALRLAQSVTGAFSARSKLLLAR
jgi:hypothetical protein